MTYLTKIYMAPRQILLKFTAIVLDVFDSEKVAVATFMNRNKDFDCVNHEVLIAK